MKVYRFYSDPVLKSKKQHFWERGQHAQRNFYHILNKLCSLQGKKKKHTVKHLLVGGFNPFEKYYIVKLEIFPR